MKAGILSIVLALILVLSSLLPVLADDTGTITITMTGADEISITLSKTSWGPEDVDGTGIVSSDTTYLTSPPKEWCTLENTGNLNVDLYIQAEDARWYENGTAKAYWWTLSNTNVSNLSDPYHGHKYVLWYSIAHYPDLEGCDEEGYIFITKTPEKVPLTSSLPPGDEHAKQFGLKLLTPTYFYGGRTMKTQITISAVSEGGEAPS